MQNKINTTQQQILSHLLNNKNGLSINALAELLGITRNAVQQQFFVLEKDGYIQKKNTEPTAGRPAAVYELTDRGINDFPKQYAWFCSLLINHYLDEVGRDHLPAFMDKLGHKLADSLRGRFADKDGGEKLHELTQLLSELGFQASLAVDQEGEEIGIDAVNCVYHDLAQTYPEICGFDVALMSSLLDKPLEQTSCMAKGDCKCRFKLKAQ